MLALYVIYLGALLCYGNALNVNKPKIGGEPAPEGLAPFAVSLRTGYVVRSHFCGGTIISDKFILTAANCIDAVFSGGSLSSLLQVQSGTRNSNVDGQISYVKTNFTYFGWDPRKRLNDIGILELVSPIIEDFTQKRIPINPKVILPGQTVTAVGWGLSMVDTSYDLYYMHTNTLDHSTCTDMKDDAVSHFPGHFPAIVDEQEICTFKSVGEAMCRDDSGSALFNEDGLVGVFSWTFPCAAAAPDIFTRVSSFAHWIEDIVGN